MKAIDQTTTMATQAPLVTPKHYDPMFKVDTMLYEPTLATKCSAAEIGVDVMSLLTQLDVLCRRELLKCLVQDTGSGKTSSFFRDKASVVEDRLRQVLSKAGKYGTYALQEYMNKHAMTALFPRPLEILSNPSKLPASSERTRFDDYLSCMSQLNQVTSLSHQIQEDISTSPRPKYLAHQIALLYQSLMSLPSLGPLERFKKSIETNFKSVKKIMAADSEEQQDQPLPDDLRAWVWELTSQLAETVESMPAEITPPAVVPAMLLAHMAGHRCS